MNGTVTLVGLLARPEFRDLFKVSGQPDKIHGRLAGGLNAGMSRDAWPELVAEQDDLAAVTVSMTAALRRYADVMGLVPVAYGGRMILGVRGVVSAEIAQAPGFAYNETAGDCEDQAAVALDVARQVLAPSDARSADDLAAQLAVIAGLAGSRHRAQSERANLPGGPDVTGRTKDADADLIEMLAVTRPYARYFAVDEMRLRHRRFDGTMSDEMLRAVFLSGDAVVVLPWDPVRDRVLLIEQFRAGPTARHDPQPWIMETIAGRIDGGETPQAAARREAEAGIKLQHLFPGPHNYSSPGMVAEFLYLYVGVADLPDEVAGIGGLVSENEDIKSHIISRAELTRRALAGELVNGPLLTLALWLEIKAPQLRAVLTA